MAIKNQALTVNFYAYDTTNNVGKTGDSANFTMRLVKDGGAAGAPTNAVSEPDSTNMPGTYELELTADEMNANFVTLHGKSGTANIVILPLFIATERGEIATADAVADSIYAIVNSGTYGNSALKKLIDTIDTVVDAIKAVTDNLPNSGSLSSLSTLTLAQLRTALGTNGSDQCAELSQGIPSATPSVAAALMLLYMSLRNKVTATSTEKAVYNDAGTKIAKKAVSDDESTYTEDEMISGA